MQWAQFYNIKKANPYNQPHLSHIGVPAKFSKEYNSTLDIASVVNSCSGRLLRFGRKTKLNANEYDHGTAHRRVG